MNKGQLLERGRGVLAEFCSINQLPAPDILQEFVSDRWNVSACAYYRHSEIYICVPRCAAIGVAGQAWSCPGYTVDRTPYGVLQHELGHHCDVLRSKRKSSYYGDFSLRMREVTGEKQISSYCPNDAEWFAEIFRVFVTNPDMLRLVRPRTHRELLRCFKPVFADAWRDRLKDAPPRTIKAAERQIEAAGHDQAVLI